LLLCPDNPIRRNLARVAADAGWSVRELETRARAAVSPHNEAIRERHARSNADKLAAVQQITDVLGSALGADVKVKSTSRGYAAQLSFDSLDEALQFAAGVKRTGK
jgi:ParB family chromosome partitioning protein